MKYKYRSLTGYMICFFIYIVFQYLYYLTIDQKKEKLDAKGKDDTPPEVHEGYIPSKYERLYFESDVFNISSEVKRPREDKKIILLYNIPAFLIPKTSETIRYHNCEYQNCIFTRDMKRLSTAHALIFYVGIKNERLGKYPPIRKEDRRPDQVWIFTATEPPEHYYNTDFLQPSWFNTMNWSSLYRLDSDIPIPYGALIRQDTDESPDYISIFNKKSKNAVWYVSHCQVASERRLFVKEMIRNGFNIDIFGGCGSEGKRTKTNHTDYELTIQQYKFYLAFENSLCNDYITEKFFRNYNFNWIIIVRGGADYNRLCQKGTFINTADFPDIPSLVKYLNNLANDRNKYVEYLRNKDRYKSIKKPFNRDCEICRRLNNLQRFKKTYTKIGNYVIDGQCKRANDI